MEMDLYQTMKELKHKDAMTLQSLVGMYNCNAEDDYMNDAYKISDGEGGKTWEPDKEEDPVVSVIGIIDNTIRKIFGEN